MASILPSLAVASAVALMRLLPRLSAGDRSWIARRLMRERFSPEARAFAAFCTQAVHAWKNKQYDIHQNGEEALLKRLARFRPSVLLDVGANEGDWSIAACTALPEARVHAFEIVPAMAAQLADGVARFGDRVTVNAVGLSDRTGSITIYRTPDDSTKTSALQISPEHTATETPKPLIAEEAETRTGDSYVTEHGIERIDLLKIDVEGAEQNVLRGFEQTFGQGRITLVQFEYGWVNAHNGFLLRDAYTFFEAHGFVLGKLYPEGVAFKPYTYADEDFIGPNYVACRTDRADIIDRLRCEPP